jgi:hypothetical protein
MAEAENIGGRGARMGRVGLGPWKLVWILEARGPPDLDGGEVAQKPSELRLDFW